MVNPGLISDDHTLSFECTLPGSPEQVWFHLTQSTGLKTWLAEGSIEARPRGTVRLHFRSDEALVRSNCGVLVRGVISRYAPHRSLAYSWIDGSRSPGMSHRLSAPAASTVTFELAPREGHTWLSLNHAGLPTHVLSTIGTGWRAHLRLLIAAMQNQDEIIDPATDNSTYHERRFSLLRNALHI